MENLDGVVNLNDIYDRLVVISVQENLGSLSRDECARVVWSTNLPEEAMPEDHIVDWAKMNQHVARMLRGVKTEEGQKFNLYTKMEHDAHQVIIDMVYSGTSEVV